MQPASLQSTVHQILHKSDAIAGAKASLRATLVDRLLRKTSLPAADRSGQHDEAVSIVADLLQSIGLKRTLSVLEAEYGAVFPVSLSSLHQVRVVLIAVLKAPLLREPQIHALDAGEEPVLLKIIKKADELTRKNDQLKQELQGRGSSPYFGGASSEFAPSGVTTKTAAFLRVLLNAFDRSD